MTVTAGASTSPNTELSESAKVDTINIITIFLFLKRWSGLLVVGILTGGILGAGGYYFSSKTYQTNLYFPGTSGSLLAAAQLAELNPAISDVMIVPRYAEFFTNDLLNQLRSRAEQDDHAKDALRFIGRKIENNEKYYFDPKADLNRLLGRITADVVSFLTITNDLTWEAGPALLRFKVTTTGNWEINTQADVSGVTEIIARATAKSLNATLILAAKDAEQDLLRDKTEAEAQLKAAREKFLTNLPNAEWERVIFQRDALKLLAGTKSGMTKYRQMDVKRITKEATLNELLLILDQVVTEGPPSETEELRKQYVDLSGRVRLWVEKLGDLDRDAAVKLAVLQKLEEKVKGMYAPPPRTDRPMRYNMHRYTMQSESNTLGQVDRVSNQSILQRIIAGMIAGLFLAVIISLIREIVIELRRQPPLATHAKTA